jgi:hypothetical protein
MKGKRYILDLPKHLPLLMARDSILFSPPRRTVWYRWLSYELGDLLHEHRASSGIYLIGCLKEIVYVGQSINLANRSIQSFEKFYLRTSDASQTWSIALAPCPTEEMNERESTAICAYAPKFNTSIPSIGLSQGRMPKIVGAAQVFEDQEGRCAAFESESLRHQIEIAQTNPKPPWKRKRTRRKVVIPEPRRKKSIATCKEFDEWDYNAIKRSFGVPCERPLPFKINLCEGGDVVTRDGVVVGVWKLDENRQISFLPNDASEPLFLDLPLGQLCEQIKQWYEANTGDAI